jgi:glucose-6-phosphate 1-dehydrogenase
MRLGGAKMIFKYEHSFHPSNGLEAYERLILDAMMGDQSLFTTGAGVERLWDISTALLEKPPPIEPYPPGSWGPSSVHRVSAPYRWHLPERD